MDVRFVEEWRDHSKGDVAHLPWHTAKPLLDLGIVKPVHRRRYKAVRTSEHAVKQ